jgi:hypothetical protein
MRAMFAALATLPFVAHAQPVIVEYEGVVEAVEPSPYWDYAVGDSIKGVVRIYPVLAPPDRHSADWAGLYESGPPPENFVVSDFVTADRNGDYVNVWVGPASDDNATDRYVLSDRSEIIGAAPGANWRDFAINVEGRNLVKDDGIAHAFEAIPKKDGSSIVSALIQGLGEFRRVVTFSMSRVSVGMPGSCSR